MPNQFDIEGIAGRPLTGQELQAVGDDPTLTGRSLEASNPALAVSAIQRATSPVGVISTDEAVRRTNENINKLEEVSPPDIPEAEKTEETKTETTDEPPTPAEGAVFSLEEAKETFGTDFTGLHMNEEGNFVADKSAIERLGITGLEDDEGAELERDLAEVDSQIEDLNNQLTTYNVDEDPAFQRTASNIRGQFGEIRRQMEKINKSRQRALQSIGFRTGSRQFAGAIQLGIEGEELNQANSRISEINRQEAAAIDAARQAIETGEFRKLNQVMTNLQNIRNAKADALTSYNESLADFNKKLEEENEKINKEIRDDQIQTNVLNLINAGSTDPLEILTQLTAQGVDATVDEVQKFTNLIANNDTLKNLSQDLRTYEFLKKNQPSELEAMGVTTYEEYIRAINNAKRAQKTDKPDLRTIGGSLFQVDFNEETGTFETKLVQGKPGAARGTRTTTTKTPTAIKNDLIAGGFTSEEVDIVNDFVNEFGVDEALADPNLSEAQKTAIRNAYGVEQPQDIEETEEEALKDLNWTPTQRRAYRDYVNEQGFSVDPQIFKTQIRADLFPESDTGAGSSNPFL